MKLLGPIICAASLAACDSPPAGVLAEATGRPSPSPDLETCTATIVRQDDDPLLGEPVAVPPSFADIVRAGPTAMAITSQTGKTLCVSMIWTAEVKDMAWLQRNRLLGFTHSGWENFGYFVIDRAGNGAAIEMGERPLISPDGTRFASLQLSDSGWGGLEGFGIWEMRPDALMPITSQLTGDDGIPPDFSLNNYGEWKLEGWRGNDCIDIRQTPYDSNATDPQRAAGRSYFALEANNWDIREGTCR